MKAKEEEYREKLLRQGQGLPLNGYHVAPLIAHSKTHQPCIPTSQPSTNNDGYHEPSPMSRLRHVRSQSPARSRATLSLNRYLYQSVHQEYGRNGRNGGEWNSIRCEETKDLSDGVRKEGTSDDVVRPKGGDWTTEGMSNKNEPREAISDRNDVRNPEANNDVNGTGGRSGKNESQEAIREDFENESKSVDGSQSVNSGETTVENGVEMTYSMTNNQDGKDESCGEENNRAVDENLMESNDENREEENNKPVQENLIKSNAENCGDDNNKPAQEKPTKSNVKNCGEENKKLIQEKSIKSKNDEKPLQAAANTLVESMLHKSNKHKSLLRLQTSDSNDSLVSRDRSLTGLKNRHFGKTERSLLTLKDPRMELQKSLSREAPKNMTNKTKKAAPKYHRRADIIEHHRCNVGSTLKSIGIEPNKHVLSKKVHPKMTSRTPTPKKKRRALSTIMTSPKKQINTHRRKVYEAIRTKRSLDVQIRRGVATPQVRKVSYQRYSFLERKRLGILKSGLIKSQDFDNCSSNTVVSIDSTSSSYCDEMLAHVRELRKTRLSLPRKLGVVPIIEGNSHSINHNSYNLATQVVKRRKARVSLANAQIERTWSADSQMTSASDKRRKAMVKIRKNKMKALGLEPEC